MLLISKIKLNFFRMKYYKHHFFLILNLVGLNCPLILLSERITQAFYSSYLE